MYDCELHNGESCKDFTCKEPCEFNAQYGFCYDKCMKHHVCACCDHWKNDGKEVEYV